jgi:uncharacterized protein YukE
MSVSPTPPASFDPLDTRNGVPGDAGEVTSLARRYADTAAEIEAQAANLRRLTSQARSGWKGEAGENFAAIAGDLAERIGRAKRRYEAAAQALSHFGNRLDDVQTAAYGAVRRAQSGEDEQRALRSSRPGPASVGATPEQAAAVAEEQRLHDRAVAAAGSRMSAARTDYDRAVEDYRSAAREAAAILRDGRGDDGLADSWWDRSAGWISDVLDVIGAVLLVLAIATVVIGVFVPGLAILGIGVFAALSTAGTVLTAVSFGGHLALWLTDNGKGSDVLWDLAGLATFGLGTGVARLARGLLGAAVRTGSRIAAARAGRQAFSTAGRPGLFYDLGRFVPFARPALSLSPSLRAAFTSADEGASAARATVEALASTPSSLGSRAFTLGDSVSAQLVSAVAQINRAVPGSARLAALDVLTRSVVGGGITVPQAVTSTQSVVDDYGTWVTEPSEDARQADARVRIVDQWSMPLLQVR